MGHPDWVIGYGDEVWWSRFAQPNLQSWAEENQQLRLIEQIKGKEDADPKALACYGLLMRWWPQDGQEQEKSLAAFRRRASCECNFDPVSGVGMSENG